MRIVVSGTHASGKSTLISDLAVAHPEYSVLGDPFDDLLDDLDVPGPSVFLSQLRIAAARLSEHGSADLVAERGPLDFLAYLLAWRDLGRGTIGDELVERCAVLASEAMRTVDLLLLLRAPDVYVPPDEDPELRAAMQGLLFELCDDAELIGSARVQVIDGSPAERLAAVEAALL